MFYSWIGITNNLPIDDLASKHYFSYMSPLDEATYYPYILQIGIKNRYDNSSFSIPKSIPKRLSSLLNFLSYLARWAEFTIIHLHFSRQHVYEPQERYSNRIIRQILKRRKSQCLEVMLTRDRSWVRIILPPRSSSIFSPSGAQNFDLRASNILFPSKSPGSTLARHEFITPVFYTRSMYNGHGGWARAQRWKAVNPNRENKHIKLGIITS